MKGDFMQQKILNILLAVSLVTVIYISNTQLQLSQLFKSNERYFILVGSSFKFILK